MKQWSDCGIALDVSRGRSPDEDWRKVTIFGSRLVRRERVAHQTLACVLERPRGFAFRAGQYIDVTLPEPLYDDLLGPTRSFSIASSPTESDLLLLMRMRNSAFKRSIAGMPLGAPVLVDGPADDLAFNSEGGRPLVMLAGGVGIAPFLGALREVAATHGSLAGTLYYANRRPEDAAFLAELLALEGRVAGYRCVATMKRMRDSAMAWRGDTERLGAVMLGRHLPALVGPRYYLSGSTLFISGLRQELARAGVPGSDIRTEMYTGY
jgi:ferredoxin-NADP reductase